MKHTLELSCCCLGWRGHSKVLSGLDAKDVVHLEVRIADALLPLGAELVSESTGAVVVVCNVPADGVILTLEVTVTTFVLV